MVKVKYVGDGSFFPGVPAADHETDEKEAERLVASGLYVAIEPKKSEKADEKKDEKVDAKKDEKD